MTTANHVVSIMNPNTPGLNYVPNDKTILQEMPIGTCPQNEELSSKDEDSRQTVEAYGLQWLCNVVFGIGRLVGDLPIHVEIPDNMPLLKSDCLKDRLDNPGWKGQNGSSLLGVNTPSPMPNYEDGTWMTIRIQIPRTTSDLPVPPKSFLRLDDDSIMGELK